MNGRLYRLTPAGGKPNHYTDSYASALGQFDGLVTHDDLDMQVGDRMEYVTGQIVERVA